MALVIYLSLTPMPPSEMVLSNDKMGHFSAYLVLMWWFAQLCHSPKYSRLAIGFIGLGILLECLQGLTGTRTFDPMDVVANSLGVLSGWGLRLTHRPFLVFT